MPATRIARARVAVLTRQSSETPSSGTHSVSRATPRNDPPASVAPRVTLVTDPTAAAAAIMAVERRAPHATPASNAGARTTRRTWSAMGRAELTDGAFQLTNSNDEGSFIDNNSYVNLPGIGWLGSCPPGAWPQRWPAARLRLGSR